MKKSSVPFLQMRGISKSYPGVQALDNVDLTLQKGEILALVGENGAGKTTLIKILGGIEKMDNGTIHINGRLEEIGSPRHARTLGFSFIHQELELISRFNTVENLFLGLPYPRKGIFINWVKMAEIAKDIMRKFDFDFDIKSPVKYLKTSYQWMASIMRAFIIDSKSIIFDEPTVALEEKYVAELFNAIRTLKREKKSIIYISHRLEEVFEIADRIMVLKNGKNVITLNKDATNREELIEYMTGRKIVNLFPERRYSERKGGKIECALSLEKVSRGGRYKNINITIKKGEIVGLFGLAGSGITDLTLGIFGILPFEKGTLKIGDQCLDIKSPIDSINHKMVLIPEDRLKKGLVLNMSVKENVTLPVLKKVSALQVVKKRKEKEIAENIIKDLRIATPSIHQRVKNLSGGNKQKVSLGKWLTSENDIFIFNEPTVGIDVGSKTEIYKIIESIADKDKGVLIVSFNLPEILGLADRIIVMREGRIVGEVEKQDADENKILRMAYGLD
jgi:ribose transport system ATP-binding protein